MTPSGTHDQTRSRPLLVFVLGVARSGTSALTRFLSLSGVAIPSGMLGAGKHNQRGYWEPRDSIILNSSFLARCGSSWWDPSLRLSEDDGIDPEMRAAHVADIVTFLRRLPVAPATVVKELRITALSDLWFEAAEQAGFDTAAVIAVRHPEEVVASLAEAGKAPHELASALWLKYSLLAERRTRGIPRVFVDYAELLDDWRRESKRISATLALDLDAPDEQAIDEFLSPDLRHQRHGGAISDPFGSDWMSVVYETTAAAARDEAWNPAALDRVYREYETNERCFRLAFDGSRRYTNGLLNRISHPALMKPVFELQAMARMRRGSWA